MMKKYKIHLDKKVRVKLRFTTYIEADSPEEAKRKAVAFRDIPLDKLTKECTVEHLYEGIAEYDRMSPLNMALTLDGKDEPFMTNLSSEQQQEYGIYNEYMSPFEVALCELLGRKNADGIVPQAEYYEFINGKTLTVLHADYRSQSAEKYILPYKDVLELMAQPDFKQRLLEYSRGEEGSPSFEKYVQDWIAGQVEESDEEFADIYVDARTVFAMYGAEAEREDYRPIRRK